MKASESLPSAQFLRWRDVIGNARGAHEQRLACASEGWCKARKASIKAGKALAAARRPVGHTLGGLEAAKDASLLPVAVIENWRFLSGNSCSKRIAAWALAALQQDQPLQ